MTQQAQAELVKAGSAPERFTQLINAGNMRTAQELRERVAAVQEVAFVLTPAIFAQFAPGYQGTPQVVVIDPSVDPESGRGNDVYFQRSIHKSRKNEQGDWVPLEVSLNKYGLLRILQACGVDVSDPTWIQDGEKEAYLWMCQVGGTVLEFTGHKRKLPPGIGSLDARDGSADIGEWTPEAWAEKVKIANAQREKTAEKDRWKVKPEPINGWTAERVMQLRTKGRQITQAKAINSLARNLGVRQSYTIEELRRKPFVTVQVSFVPDMTNPEIAKMVTAHHLGALNTLYPAAGAALPPATTGTEPITHAYGEAGQTFEGELAAQEPAERMKTAAPPQGLEEVAEPEPAKKAEPEKQQALPIYTILKVFRKGKAGAPDVQYFVETKEGVTLFTKDESLLGTLQAAAKDNQPRQIETERIMVADQPYREIMEITAPGGVKY